MMWAFEHRHAGEGVISQWWHEISQSLLDDLTQDEIDDISKGFDAQLEARTLFFLNASGMPSGSSQFNYVKQTIQCHGKAIFMAWKDAVCIYDPAIALPGTPLPLPHDAPSQAHVIIAQDGENEAAISSGLQLLQKSANLTPPGLYKPDIQARLARISSGQSKVRWCIDSGANRDICKDISLSKGKAVRKSLVIGEAGRGHSFSLKRRGLSRVQFAIATGM